MPTALRTARTGSFLVRNGQAEDRHDRVADVLLDLAAVARDFRRHGGEIPLLHLVQRFRSSRSPSEVESFISQKTTVTVRRVSRRDRDALSPGSSAERSGVPQYPHS
jgi:hypothetical protein